MGRVEGGPPGLRRRSRRSATCCARPTRHRRCAPRCIAPLPACRPQALGTVTDELGRRGLGLAFDSHGTRHELIFSAATSALLAERDVVIGRPPEAHTAPGTVIGWSTYSAGRIVDRLPASPPLALTPPCVQGGGTGRRCRGTRKTA